MPRSLGLGLSYRAWLIPALYAAGAMMIALTGIVFSKGRRFGRTRVSWGLHVLPMCAALVAASVTRLPGQELAPRAYVIAPIDSNAIILTWSFYDGGVNLDGSVPITGATGRYHVPILSYYHSLSFFGRSANITASLPYGVGNFQGRVLGTQKSVYRSGLLDFNVRFSVNLIGGPAMPIEKFAKWRQKTLLGASVKVVMPTGQYNPAKLVNWGINRWAFKPELGYSRLWSNNWMLDAYGSVWFFTTNQAFFNIPVPSRQLEGPIGSFEGHLSRNLGKPRFWVSLDGNFWFGGTTTLGRIQNSNTRQTSSRAGVTMSVPVGKHQSFKFAFSKGSYVRYGGDYDNVQVAWQYGWVGWP